jgi:hypothetical protein
VLSDTLVQLLARNDDDAAKSKVVLAFNQDLLAENTLAEPTLVSLEHAAHGSDFFGVGVEVVFGCKLVNLVVLDLRVRHQGF